MTERVGIKEDFIKLDSLLKFAGVASTGGEAKELIQSGDVLVDGEPATQRGRKIKPGMTVEAGKRVLYVEVAAAAAGVGSVGA
ncbi:MAG: RNA-binding S4 domain-containing protein [Oscillospiraceae bacterium]|jgi:ribosome-associated protein|nr:RNA-binding S4 domain-containing protein [Oscillospiraceae bacterium]